MVEKIIKTLTILFLISMSGILGWYLGQESKESVPNTPFEIIKPRPLEKYSIENLSETKVEPGKFEIKEVISEEKFYTSYLFEFDFDPTLQGGSPQDIKTTTGQINLPSGEEVSPADKFPIIIMLRGYVDQELYKTGDGTRNAAAYFAENGFITIAPDFLGYADSDEEAENIFESRFQTYTTVLTLLDSLDQIDRWDKRNIFIWGHSNGGQIALTVLEITEKNIPTALWAPVSKPFPYSVLYYTDESEDRGKLIRRELAEFEDIYDTDLYSLTEYFDKINAPIQIHQGTADDAVPLSWSNELYNILSGLNLDLDLPSPGLRRASLDYHKYPGADHNMHPVWNTVISRDRVFFQKYLD